MSDEKDGVKPLDEILSEAPKGEAREQEAQEVEAKAPDAQEEEEQVEATEKEAEAREGEADAQESVKLDQTVPLATFLDMKAELAALKKQAEEASAKAQEKPDFAKIFAPQELGDRPDPLSDPEKFAEWQQGGFENQQRGAIQQQSYVYASRYYGKEKTDAALLAFSEEAQNNPMLVEQAKTLADPVGEIVEWHQKQEVLKAVQAAGGLDALKESLRKELVAEAGKTPQARATEAKPENKTKPAAPMPTEDFDGGSAAMPKEKPFNPTSLGSIIDR